MTTLTKIRPECRSGETGRRAGLKIPFGSHRVGVRLPPPAPPINDLQSPHRALIRSYGHRGQMLHRDLTPVNVCVCEGPCLKLGAEAISVRFDPTPVHPHGQLRIWPRFGPSGATSLE